MGVQIDNAFNRDETAKNNEVQRNETVLNGKVSRGATTAQVTGQIPKGMQYSSNPFFDDNGNPIEDIDYKKVIEQAIARGDTQTAQAARVARGVKIWNNYSKYGQYDDGDYGVPNTQTEDARQFDAQIKNSTDLAKMGYEHEERMPGIEADNTIRVNDASANNEMAVANNQSRNNIAEANNASRNTRAENTSATSDAINAYKQTGGGIGGTSSKSSSKSSSGIDLTATDGNVDTEWNEFYNSFSDKPKVQQFLNDYIKRVYDDADTNNYSQTQLENRIIEGIKNNTEQYDIEVKDAKRILNNFGMNAGWLDNYRDRWGLNSGKGMIKVK